MIQWTSFLLRCLSQDARTTFRGITSRIWGADILAAGGGCSWTPEGTLILFIPGPILYVVVIPRSLDTDQHPSKLSKPNKNRTRYTSVVYPGIRIPENILSPQAAKQPQSIRITGNTGTVDLELQAQPSSPSSESTLYEWIGKAMDRVSRIGLGKSMYRRKCTWYLTYGSEAIRDALWQKKVERSFPTSSELESASNMNKWGLHT